MLSIRLFFSIFLGAFLLSYNVAFARDTEFIKIPDGISYFDIDGDGVKDIIINAEFLTPFGGNLYKAYSFYLKREKTLRYVPIQLENDVRAEAVIYTYSKFTGCGASINKEENTNISGIRMLKKGKDIYLFFVRKNCSDVSDLFRDKCKFKVVVYKYDEEDQGFAKYKDGITNKLYCDAEEVFARERRFLLNLIK